MKKLFIISCLLLITAFLCIAPVYSECAEPGPPAYSIKWDKQKFDIPKFDHLNFKLKIIHVDFINGQAFDDLKTGLNDDRKMATVYTYEKGKIRLDITEFHSTSRVAGEKTFPGLIEVRLEINGHLFADYVKESGQPSADGIFEKKLY